MGTNRKVADSRNVQRRKLGNMMNVDIIQCDDLNKLDDSRGVDMGFALGFGDKQCVQADFLVPAILAMANELGVPLVVIPEGKPTNRPFSLGVLRRCSRLSSTPEWNPKALLLT